MTLRRVAHAACIALTLTLCEPACWARAEQNKPLAALAAAVRESGNPPQGDRARDLAALVDSAARPDLSLASALALADKIEAWAYEMNRQGTPRFVLAGAPPDARTPGMIEAARAITLGSAALSASIDRAVQQADALLPAAGPVDEDLILRAVHTRQIILPVRAARAAAFLAMTSQDPAIAQRLAESALETALRIEPVSPWSEAERRLAAGVALLALKKYEDAAGSFKPLASFHKKEEAAPEAWRTESLFDAAIGESIAILRWRGPVTAREMLTNALKGPDFLAENTSALQARLAVIDALIAVSKAEAAAIENLALRRRAEEHPWKIARQIAVEASPTDRAAIYQHLGQRPVPRAAPDQIHPMQRAARAAHLARIQPDEPIEALGLLAPFALDERAPEDAVDRDAWLLYASLASSKDGTHHARQASLLGARFASCCAADPRAPSILIAAARAAESAWRAAPPQDSDQDYATLLDLLRTLAGDAIALEPAERDRWRLALARLLHAEVERGPFEASAHAAREAIASLARVSHPESLLEAQRFTARVLASLLSVAEDAKAPDLPDTQQAVRRIASQLLEAADPRSVAAAGSAAPQESSREMAVWRARALVAMGRPADAWSEIEPQTSTDDPPASDEAIFVACESLMALERDSDARAILARSNARFEERLARRSDLEWRETQTTVPAFPDPQNVIAAPVAVYRLAAEHAPDPASAAMQRTRLGWALLLNGRPEPAAESFSEALELDPMILSARRGLAEALLAGADEAGAFAQFRAIADSLGQGGEAHDDWWRAWTRMIEILARREPSPDHVARVRREIERLRALPSAVQRPDCMARLEAVARTIGSAATPPTKEAPSSDQAPTRSR